MTTFRNTAKGSRGILLTTGSYVMIEPGQAKTVPGDKIKKLASDLIEVSPAEAEPGLVAEGGDDAELPAPPSSISTIDGSLAQLDHDGDGKPGGSLPVDPPSLFGMRKDDLIAQAEAEGILTEQIKGTGANGDVVADDIRAAIEAKRAAAS